GSAQGIGLSGGTFEALTQINLTGVGGSSASQGAAGVLVSNGTTVTNNGGPGNVGISGTAGRAAGSSGGSGVGVILGSQVDTVGSKISTPGTVTITGTGGTGTNTGATGVAIFGPTGAQSLLLSGSDVTINGTAGTVV